MASNKRAGPLPAINDEDGDDGFGSDNQEEAPPRKAARTSGAGNERVGKGASSSSSSAYDDGIGAMARHDSDGFDEDDDGEDDGDMDASAARPAGQYKYHDQTMTGIITRVAMRNIRCHEALEVELGPRVNFVSGLNGSGKSSLLTAIILALGGEPKKITSGENKGRAGGGGEVAARWDNVIRWGCDTCTVEVDLLNKGQEAIERETWGDVVTVKRDIKRSVSGDRVSVSSKFTLINKATRAVIDEGTKPESITAMRTLLAKLNLDVTNPVVVMDQEHSKSFITGDSKEFYSFFMKATLLSSNFAAILGTVENLNRAHAAMKAADGDITDLKDAFDKHRKRFEAISALSKQQAQLTAADHDILWALYTQDEAALQTQRADVAKLNDQKAMLTSTLGPVQARLAAAEKRKDDAESGLAQTNATRAALKVTAESKVEELRAAANALDFKKKELKAAQDTVSRAERRVGDAQASLANIDAELKSRDKGAERRVWQERIDRASAAVAAAEGEIEAARGDAADEDETRERLADAEEAEGAARRAVNDRERELQASRARLGKLRNDSGSRDPLHPLREAAASNHRKATAILKAIDLVARHKSEFRDDVLGPVFRHTTCTDASWIGHADAALGMALEDFVFTSREDAALFERLLRGANLGREVSYLVRSAKATAKATTCPPPVPGRTRLLDVIDVDNPSVYNEILRSSKADKTLLFRRDEEESWVTVCCEVDSSGNRVMRRNVDKAILADGRSAQVKGTTGGMAIRSLGGEQRAMRLLRPASVADQTKTAEAEVREDEVALAIAKEDLRVAAEARSAAARTVNTFAQRFKGLEAALKRAQTDLVRARAMPEPEVPDDDEDEQLLVNARHDVESAKQKAADARAKLPGILAQLAPLEAEMARLRAETIELQKALTNDPEVEKASNEVSDAAAEVQTQQLMLKKAQAGIERITVMYEASKKVYLEDKAKLDEMRADVVQRTGKEAPRDPSLSVKQAKADRAAVEARVKAEQDRFKGEDAKKVSDEYYLAKAAYESARAKMEQLRKNNESLRKLKAVREKAFKRNKKAAETRCKEIFELLVAKKGYVGELTVETNVTNFDEGRILVRIAPDVAQRYGTQALMGGNTQFGGGDFTQGAAVQALLREVGSLSGGEKSYSGLMLLTAITKTATNIPFHLVDEFDVFQDEFSRQLSINILLESALEQGLDNRNAQYIFFTPYDISSAVNMMNLDPAQRKAVKVIKMKAPVKAGAAGAAGAGAGGA